MDVVRVKHSPSEPDDARASRSIGAGPIGTSLLDLTVVVVNYNVRDFLENALESVERAASDIEAEVIVVDNDSADGSVEMVRQRFPGVRVIANRENVGFSAANNQALKIARGRAILLLNPDTIVQEDTLRVMLRFMADHPEAGAVGCMILNPDGTFAPESRRAFPTPAVALSRILGLSRLFPRSRLFGRYNMTYLPPDVATEVDALSGSCMLIRRAALVGTSGESIDEGAPPSLLFDEGFFMYGEDLDLCYRIQLSGWKLFYTPATQIIHYKGESTKKGDLRYVKLFYGAMLRFTEKHFSGQYSSLFRAAIRAGIFVRGGASAVAKLARRSVAPLADFLIVFATVGAVALLRFGDLPEQMLYTIAPAYAGVTVATMGLSGAYRPARRYRLRFVMYSVLVGLISVAALSFFVKSIAYSRAVVLLSAPVAAAVMGAWRIARRRTRNPVTSAIIVGTPAEALRVAQQLWSHPAPPFQLMGYVCDESEPPAEGAVKKLGVTRQLRDVVRLSRADTVVFAAGSNTRRDIFGWMQLLRDLPVTLRMLDTRESYVIGKSSIDQLSLGEFVEADVALGISRSTWSHRFFDVAIAVAGLCVAPLVFLLSLAGNSRMARAWTVVKQLPGVLAGRRAVVGYDEAAPYRPPESWGLRPGIVPVIQPGGPDGRAVEAEAAYGYYAMHQSASADWAILRNVLRGSRDAS